MLQNKIRMLEDNTRLDIKLDYVPGLKCDTMRFFKSSVCHTYSFSYVNSYRFITILINSYIPANVSHIYGCGRLEEIIRNEKTDIIFYKHIEYMNKICDAIMNL